MKINAVSAAKHRGSVLLVALVISAVLGITLASYLTLVSFQSRSVARAQHWNQALVIAEAGIEEGLQMVNKGASSPNLTNWVNTYGGDGWSRSGQVYILPPRFMDAEKTIRYSVFITNMNAQNTDVIITSVGYVTLPSALGSSTTLSRTVVVRAKIRRYFNVAMAALGAIDLKGNNVATDSFDSTDTNWSTNGTYDPLKRKANGDVATNNTITNSVLSVGNADVAGHLLTGPFGSVDINNGSVGSISWVDAKTKGIEAGYQRNDMNVVFDDVELPTSSGWTPSTVFGYGGPGTAPDGNTYDHVYTSSGDYELGDNGTIYVATNVTVRIRATADTFQPDSIHVAGPYGTAGKLIAYLEGTKAVLGTEHTSQSKNADSIQIFGLPKLTDIAYRGNGNFSGVIYAPQAFFHLGGGGSDIWDFIGSSVTREVQMNGHYKFHYDESLAKKGPPDAYVATGWKEL